MKKYFSISILCVLVFSSCIEISSSNHDIYLINKTGNDITVFYVLSRDKESIEMQVANGNRLNILIIFPGDQSAYSEEEMDLVFEKISFYDGKDTVPVDLENTSWRRSKSGEDGSHRTHSYFLDLTR